MTDLAEEILAKTFTGTRFREGYAMADVDDFLDRVVETVRRGDDLTPLIDGAVFRAVKFGEGYDMSEVDGFLDVLKARSRQVATETAPTPNSSTVPEPTLPTSTGGLRGWLFGRR